MLIVRNFGDNVRAAMLRRGMSREDLAARLGVGATTVDKQLLPTANPRLDTLLRYAKALGVSVESLVEHVDDAYDAMRQPDRSPARREELWGRLESDVEAQLWRLLLTLAGAPIHRGSPGPPPPPSEPQTAPAPVGAAEEEESERGLPATTA